MSAFPVALVSRAGVERVLSGHPWIFRSDVSSIAGTENGDVVEVCAASGPRRNGPPPTLGYALFSAHSEIRLRVVSKGGPPEPDWIERRLRSAIAMRDAVLGPIEPLGARRLVHGEADGLPGLVVDRYGEHLVAQFLTFGMDRREKEVARALDQLVQPRGILARNDPKVREREGLVVETRLISGDVPRNLTMREGAVDLSVDPWSGQKTGAFIDQKSNHLRFGELARGRVLDAFCHDGGFGLQAAKKGASVIAVDSSAEACARAKVNARTNQVADRFEVVQANAFDFLTARAEARDSYDAIALDPPAFAKNRAAREAAARGYREINRRALSLLSPGGILVTASCSHHVGEEDFAAILAAASADAGKTVRVIERRGQPADHPGLLGMPESTYLKTLVCNALG